MNELNNGQWDVKSFYKHYYERLSKLIEDHIEFQERLEFKLNQSSKFFHENKISKDIDTWRSRSENLLERMEKFMTTLEAKFD
ncbi:hypothetical protein PGT21_014550 [Puccinia graminis f. sp. tritici]|uniref:Uncharacterized protein n=1 Tax=Puccinia graminis f. sp. tritici TaxID=56615 RepID=A0A5B0P1G6_PUCGR|nr:hypothetical protein PGT21_014550 [Puccinia graminis f. sp. tritici]